MIQALRIATPVGERGLADTSAPLPLDDLVPGDGAWEVEIGFGKGRYLLRRCEEDPGRRFLGMDLAAKGADGAPERALVYLNAGRDDAGVALPAPQPKRRWTLRLQSDWPGLEPRPLDPSAGLVVKARSVFVLVERAETD